MALRDYLTQGSYSVIDRIIYNKDNNHLRFTLYIYIDDTKQEELAQKEFLFEGMEYVKRICSIIEDKIPNPEIGEWFLVSKTSTALPDRRGSWAQFHGKDLESPDKGWEYWGINYEDEKFYYAPLDTYCKFNNKEEIEKVSAHKAKDRAWWVGIFGSSVGKNLHTQIYEYLKTTPGFENVKDA